MAIKRRSFLCKTAIHELFCNSLLGFRLFSELVVVVAPSGGAIASYSHYIDAKFGLVYVPATET